MSRLAYHHHDGMPFSYYNKYLYLVENKKDKKLFIEAFTIVLGELELADLG